MSVDAIKKFLTDSQNYPDATMVKIGDTEVPLGSLRQLNAGDREALSTAIKANADRAAELDTRQKQVVELAGKAQAAYNAAEEARAKAASNPGGTPPADPFADPWLAPVKQALDTRDKSIAELKDLLGKMANSVVNAATIFSEDRWDREYSSIDFGKREKKPTRDELLEFAKNNNLTDRHKLPSVRAAWDKMSEADRLADAKKTEYERGIEEGKMQALANRIPQPGVPGPGMSTAPPKVNVGSGDLGDLYAEAIKDPELRQLIEQLPQGMA